VKGRHTDVLSRNTIVNHSAWELRNWKGLRALMRLRNVKINANFMFMSKAATACDEWLCLQSLHKV